MLRSILRGLLDLVAPQFCPGCDELLPLTEQGFCETCDPLLERRTLGPAAYDYGGPMAVAIRELKYQQRIDLAAPLAALLGEAAAIHLGRVDVVVPIPLHPTRLAERGYNQSALLAEGVARRLAIPMSATRLVRVRPTPPQAGLDRRRRELSVHGAFEAKPGPRRVLLVDDVRTTGATLRAGCAALYRRGATEVRALALAGQD